MAFFNYLGNTSVEVLPFGVRLSAYAGAVRGVARPTFNPVGPLTGTPAALSLKPIYTRSDELTLLRSSVRPSMSRNMRASSGPSE